MAVESGVVKGRHKPKKSSKATRKPLDLDAKFSLVDLAMLADAAGRGRSGRVEDHPYVAAPKRKSSSGMGRTAGEMLRGIASGIRSQAVHQGTPAGGNPWGDMLSADAGVTIPEAPNLMALLDQYVSSIPAIDRNAYVKPYDDAMSAANQVHAQVVPSLEGIYRGLAQTMTDRAGDWSKQTEANQAALAAEQQRLLADQQAVQSQGMQSLQAQGVEVPELLGQAAARGGELLGAMQANQATDQATMDALQRVQEQSMRERQADVPAMEAASKANASTNLQALLQKIGLGRAEAERDYESDVAQRNAELAKLKMDFAMRQQEADAQAATSPFEAAKAQMEMERHEMDKERFERERAEYQAGRVGPDGKPTKSDPRQEFLSTRWPQLQATSPKASRAMMDMISAASGPEEATALLYSGTDEQFVEKYGFKPDRQVIEKWMREYYGLSR